MKKLTKSGKKTLAVIMAVLMVMTTWVFVAPTKAEALTFTDYFYVPETIYLKPSDNKTFQYYVNRSQDTTGTLSTAQDTSGKIYFQSNNATKVSISCSGASISYGASSATGTTLSTTFTGSLSSAITMNSTTVITWTATITTSSGTYTQYAYTVCYAPNRNVTAAGATGFDFNSSESYASSMIWLSGVHSAGTASVPTGDGTSNEHRLNYQNISTSGKYLDPLVNGVAAPSNNNPHDYGNKDTSPFTGATKSFATCYCVRANKKDGNGDWVMHNVHNGGLATLTVDTSRYTNLNQIPNVKLGFAVTDLENSNKRRNAFLSDCTGYTTTTGANAGSSNKKDTLLHYYWASDNYSKDFFQTAVGTVIWGGASLSGENNSADIGIKYNAAINRAISGTGTETRYYKGGASGAKDSSWAVSTVSIGVNIVKVNKSALRSAVDAAQKVHTKERYTSSTWTTYVNALKTAATALGNPTASQSTIDSAVTTLSNARKALVGELKFEKGTGPAASTVTITAPNGNPWVVALGTSNSIRITTLGNYYATAPGYEFMGWSKTNGAASGDTASLTFSENETRYATWAIHSSELQINPNGGTYGGTTGYTSMTKDYNTTVTIPAPTRTGYTFTGWTVSGQTNGTLTQNADGSSKYTFGPDNGTTTIITAGWKINSYAVKFVNEDGTELQNSTLNYGQTPSYSKAAPTKAPNSNYHYEFKAWNPEIGTVTGDKTYTATFNEIAHSGGTATCTAKAVCSVCGLEYGELAAHVLETHEARTPSCINKGWDAYQTCKNCSYTTYKEKPATGVHSFTEYVYNNDAKCGKNGTETAACDYGCGETDTRTKEGTALTHSFTEYVYNNDAKCEKDGTETATCNNGCGAKDTRTKEGSALTHSFTEYVSDNNATCVDDATETATCDNGCGKTNTRTKTGTATGIHKGGTATCTDKAVCEVCGVAYGELAPHDLVNHEAKAPTCVDFGWDAYQTCNNCSYTTYNEKAATGVHVYTTYTSNGDATCTADGTKTALCDNNCGETKTITDEGSKLGHKFTDYVSNGDATCTADGTETAKCDRCDATDTKVDEGSKLGHSFTSYVSDNDATCLEDGHKTAKCDRCDATDTVTDTGSKLGHSFTDYVSNNDATCIKDGTKTAKCGRCDATDTVTDTGSKLGHSFTSYVSDNDATCLEDGHKTATCDRCDATDTVTDTGSKLGHSFTNYVSDNDATCLEDGHKTATCDRCDATDTVTDTGSKLGHKFTNYVSNGDATCTADGTETAKCDRCDVTNTRTDEGSKLGHKFTNYVSNGDATCVKDGTKTAKCDRCDVTDTKTDVGSASGIHTPAEAVNENIVDSNCTAEGSYDSVVYCSVCGEELSRTPGKIVMKPHTDNDDNGYCDKCSTLICKHESTSLVKVTEVSCVVDGYTGDTVCDKCKNVLEYGSVIPSEGHKEVVLESDKAVAPTCTETGLTQGSHCSVCGEVIVAQKTVKALGHSFTNYISGNNATCTKDCTETAKCDRCDVTNTRNIPNTAFGHTPGNLIKENYVEATCKNGGSYYAVVYCSVCEDEASRTFISIPQLPHNDSNRDGICDDCREQIAPVTPEKDNCICHEAEKNGFYNFIYKIILFFWKLFGTNKVCECGVVHY